MSAPRSILVLVLAAFASCASTGEVRSLVEANTEFEKRVLASLEDFKGEAKKEFERDFSQRCAELRGRVEQVDNAVAQRIQLAEQSAITGIDVAGLSTAIAGIVSVLVAIFHGKRRNKTRATDPRISNQYVLVKRNGALADESP